MKEQGDSKEVKTNKRVAKNTGKQPVKRTQKAKVDETPKKAEKEQTNYITSKQIYTEEVLEDFAKFSTKNVWTIVILCCATFILICSGIMFASGDIFEALLYLFLGVFFMLYPTFLRLIMKKQNKKGVNSTDEYRFFEERLEVDSLDSNGNKFSTSNVLYTRLYKVKVNKDYAYIYLNRMLAYIVSKQNFKDENEFNFALNRISMAIHDEKTK